MDKGCAVLSTLSSDGRLDDGFIRTFTGLKFQHSNPQPEMICVQDIAHALSQLCRYAGHCRTFYSVGQHVVYCSWITPPEHALWALCHDGEEFATVDLPSPFKHLPGMEAFRTYANAIQKVIIAKFGLPATEPAAVKAADMLLLVTEQRDLMPHSDSSFPGIAPLKQRIIPWSCRKAERVFLLRFAELTGAKLSVWQRLYLWYVRGNWGRK
jgi:uncharacterized protein